MAIREKGKNKYQLIVDTTVNGKRTRRTKVVKATGKRELERLYKEFERECEVKPDVATITVAKMVEDYIDSCETRGLSANTIRGYRVCLKRLYMPFGEVLASELTPYTISRYLTAEIASTQHSTKTIRNTITLLSAAYTRAIRLGFLTENPCDRLDPIKQVKTEKQILDEDEIKRFVECLEGEPQDFKVACLLALFCGLRKSEILGLKEEDVNLNFGTVRVYKTRFDFGEQTTKTESSKRTLVAPEFVIEEIKKLLAQEHRQGEYLIQYCCEPMTQGKLGDSFTKFRNKNNFDISLHGLRHTFASMLNASGEFDIAEISSALGHASIGITLNTYTHTFKNENHSARRIASYAEKFDASKTHEVSKAL